MPHEIEDITPDDTRVLDTRFVDEVESIIAMLDGVHDALAFRTSLEDDDMLLMIGRVVDEQASALRAILGACRASRCRILFIR